MNAHSLKSLPYMPRKNEVCLFVNIVKIISFFAFIILTYPTHAHLPAELIFHRHNGEHELYDNDDGGELPTIHISTNQTFFDRSLTGINDIMYTPDFGTVSLEQGILYELRRDRLQNMRHFSNTSGGLKYRLENYSWLTPGLDWVPITQYSSDRGGRNSLATIDIGPTVGINAYGVPLYLRAGLSGRRVDSFDTDDESRGSAGAYGAFRAGSWDETLPNAPVYFYADGIGRQIENSSMTLLTSAVLGALQFAERDSLLIYGFVSLFNGREGYLENTADSRVARFIETPWRVERDVTATVGYKGAPKFIIIPAAYYSISENALSFLNDTRRRDERTVRQIISGAASTDTTIGFYYSGSLSFEWRDHDKLFDKEMAIMATARNIDSLEVNLWDYAAFEPRTAHSIILKFPESPFRLKYDFNLMRSLTEYPNYYINIGGQDTITNQDDSDRRTRLQRLAFEYKNDSILRTEVFGEWVDYDLVFLKQGKSSSNRTDNTQRIGLILEWAPINELLFAEAITAEARRGEFHFPAFHRQALQRPRYSRALSSVLEVIWQATPLVGLSGDWNIKFSDYGFWYGREYMVEVLEDNPDAQTNYYAITSKSVYYTIDIAARISPGNITVKAGGAITSANDRHYENGNYVKTNLDGYTVKPYINAAFELGSRGEIAAHLSHTFVTGNRALGYWDFRLQAECWF